MGPGGPSRGIVWREGGCHPVGADGTGSSKVSGAGVGRGPRGVAWADGTGGGKPHTSCARGDPASRSTSFCAVVTQWRRACAPTSPVHGAR